MLSIKNVEAQNFEITLCYKINRYEFEKLLLALFKDEYPEAVVEFDKWDTWMYPTLAESHLVANSIPSSFIINKLSEHFGCPVLKYECCFYDRYARIYFEVPDPMHQVEAMVAMKNTDNETA